MTKSKGSKNEKNLPCLSRVKNYHQLVVTCRASFRTPWNARSRTTAQDVLWQHMNRNTSSQPFMTPCARPVMNRIPGDLTPSWAGCWGPPYSCSMSRAIYLPAQRNRQPARPIPQTEAPIAPRQGNPGFRVTLARNMKSSPHWWFLQFPVAWRGRCHSRISSGLAKHKSRILSPPHMGTHEGKKWAGCSAPGPVAGAAYVCNVLTGNHF